MTQTIDTDSEPNRQSVTEAFETCGDQGRNRTHSRPSWYVGRGDGRPYLLPLAITSSTQTLSKPPVEQRRG